MLEINIDKDYRIINDERNFILQCKRIITGENTRGRETNPENIGKEVWDDEGYYRTIRQVLIDYSRIKTLKCNVKTFEELFQILSDIRKIIDKISDIDNLINSDIKDEKKENIKENKKVVNKEVKKIKRGK
jgi:hypothetical protein